MAEEYGWSSSQKQAAAFAWSAASKGLSQAEGYRQYEAGGGKIGKELWAEVFQSAFKIVGWRKDVRSVPLHWEIPTRMFEPYDVDWTSKYNFVAEIRYFDTATQSWQTKHIQAGFDELVSHAEWREEALRRVKEEATSPTVDWEKGIHWLTEETLARKRP